MKRFVWDEEKNSQLKETRGVSFEMVLQAIEEERLLDILEHPNKGRYAGQKLYVVEIDRYVWIIPFEEKGDSLVLKTLFPSRRYTRTYLEKTDQGVEEDDKEKF